MKSSQMWPRCKHLRSVYPPSNGFLVFVVLFWLFSTFLSRLHPNKGRSTAGTKRGMNTASNWQTHPKQSWQRAQNFISEALVSHSRHQKNHRHQVTTATRQNPTGGFFSGRAAYSLTASGMLVLQSKVFVCGDSSLSGVGSNRATAGFVFGLWFGFWFWFNASHPRIFSPRINPHYK